MAQGYLALILHAHLPFVRHPEYPDAFEENWLFEAITDTYLPLASMMERLVESGVDFRLTLSMSPTLVSMLTDAFLQTRYLARLDKLIELGEKEISRTRANPEFHTLARMYHKRFLTARQTFFDRYGRDLVGAFARFQDLGYVDIITSAATHAYLPLLVPQDTAVRAQVALGVDFYTTLFGRRPEGFWLPECGFSPGIDEHLDSYGLRYTIVETHGVTRADPRPAHGTYAPVRCPSGLTVFGRDPECSKQVWSSAEGYPGDHDYREFYRDIVYDLDLDYVRPYIHGEGIRVDTGFKYYRVTGDTNDKDVYVHERAWEKAKVHADDFVSKRENQIAKLASVMDRKPVIVAPYDAELFGHWWFEGPLWLEHVIRKAHEKKDTVRLATLGEYLEDYPECDPGRPCASSWGYNGYNVTWLNEKNDWIYRHLHHGASCMEKLATEHPRAHGLMKRALNQAARELLLAQSSDWAFMINAGAMAQYGAYRTNTHLACFNALEDQIKKKKINSSWLAEIETRDNLFPELDYRIFASGLRDQTAQSPV